MKRLIGILVVLLSFTVAVKAQLAAGGGLNGVTLVTHNDRLTFIAPYVSFEYGNMDYMTSLELGYLPKKTWESYLTDPVNSGPGATNEINYSSWLIGLSAKSSFITDFGDDFVFFGYSRFLYQPGKLEFKPKDVSGSPNPSVQPQTIKTYGLSWSIGLGSSVLIGPGYLSVEVGYNPMRIVFNEVPAWFDEHEGIEYTLTYKFLLDY